MELDEITYKINGCAMKVHRTLGNGTFAKVRGTFAKVRGTFAKVRGTFAKVRGTRNLIGENLS